jgi:hypothetical protein
MVCDGTVPANAVLYNPLYKDKTVLDDSVPFHNFNNLQLPVSMKPSDYGKVLSHTKFKAGEVPEASTGFTRFICTLNNKVFQIDSFRKHNLVKLIGLPSGDFCWKDTAISEGVFKREIKKSTKYFMGGINVLNKQQIPAKPFTSVPLDRTLTASEAFMTFDLETVSVGDTGDLVPYLISAYNGKDFITSYAEGLTLEDTKALFKDFLSKLLSSNFISPISGPRGSKAVIYAHNLSGFDGVFLVRHLIGLGKVEPLLFNSKLMAIKLKLHKPVGPIKSIVFKDSYLMLPNSLNSLCSAFNIAEPKTHFPYSLNDIFYVGLFPKLEMWDGVDKVTHKALKLAHGRKVWDFKAEAIAYCQQDCKVLHQVITQFNELIFDNFQLNIHASLTLPSLAMRIFKAQFMVEGSLYKVLGIVEQAIRKAYSGGAVDVYIPSNKVAGSKRTYTPLYYYDVNSLYPTTMYNLGMPKGRPIYFEGNIRAVEPNAQGFFFCHIESPGWEMQHPLLQSLQSRAGKGTVAGLGVWYGWLTSFEMDNAVKNGYVLHEIIKGYQFEFGDVGFKAYVDRMYNLRKQYAKSHPLNYIAKLLMNSLYGKFGMKLEGKTLVDIFNTSTDEGKLALEKLLDERGEAVKDYVDLKDGYHLVVTDPDFDPDRFASTTPSEVYHGPDVNIAVAATITAGARVFMSRFKNNPELVGNLYYSDTDSIVIDKPLPADLVGGALGQLKLEHMIKRAVFIAPKVYGLIDKDGTETIKCKGLTPKAIAEANLDVRGLELLLVEGAAHKLDQVKWYKSLAYGTITVKDIVYNLKITNNKRVPIYENGVFIDTRAMQYGIDVTKRTIDNTWLHSPENPQT